MPSILIKLYFFLKAATLTCAPDVEEGFERARRYYHIERIATISERIDESSGLILLDDGSILSHNDSGGKPIIYRIDMQGNMLDSISLPSLSNNDWESLGYDAQSQTLYIGDTGNNLNKRKNMAVYAYHLPSEKLTKYPLRYSDQTEFPPSKDNRNFDCEAITFYNGELMLFSKNRGKDDRSKQYVLNLGAADKPQALSPISKQALHKQQVTGASVSPSGKRIALLTYGRIYLFNIEEGSNNLLKNPWRVIKCNRMGQSEGICFVDEETLLFSNENRKLFKVSLNKRGKKKLEQPLEEKATSIQVN